MSKQCRGYENMLHIQEMSNPTNLLWVKSKEYYIPKGIKSKWCKNVKRIKGRFWRRVKSKQYYIPKNKSKEHLPVHSIVSFSKELVYCKDILQANDMNLMTSVLITFYVEVLKKVVFHVIFCVKWNGDRDWEVD